jgi:hypothetical protein
MTGRPLKVVFGGAFARVPGQAGLIWMVLHWVLGLRALGHQVLLVEPLGEKDLTSTAPSLRTSRNARELEAVVEAFGLRGSATLWMGGGIQTAGLSRSEVAQWARESDLLIDIAGTLGGQEPFCEIPTRVYLDLDPGFTQLWQEVDGIDMRFGGHTHFATVGLTFDRTGHGVPSCGLEWIPTPQPIVLDHWPFATELERRALTTVANWRSYGAIDANGVVYGQKVHSFRQLMDLPRRSSARFELALAIDPGEPKDLHALGGNGWELLDPSIVAGSPESYRRFIQGSYAEIAVAKSGYVDGGCGWFSDRSVCYLASGRPVIAQETGFSESLPVGEGLFAFETADDAAAAVEALESDYDRHRQAARQLAEERFDAAVVLPRLLDRVGLAA